jgi:hypothetical protein
MIILAKYLYTFIIRLSEQFLRNEITGSKANYIFQHFCVFCVCVCMYTAQRPQKMLLIYASTKKWMYFLTFTYSQSEF